MSFKKIKQLFCKHPNLKLIVSPYYIEEARYCSSCDLEMGRFFLIKKVKENKERYDREKLKKDKLACNLYLYKEVVNINDLGPWSKSRCFFSAYDEYMVLK